MKQTIFFAITLSVYSFCASGQVLQDMTGRAYRSQSVDQLEGSPFLFKAWRKASVSFANGKNLDNVYLNIDLIQNLPVFVYNDSVYAFLDSISEFHTSDSMAYLKFRNGKLIHSELPDALIEVMSDNPLIIKKLEGYLVEVPGYGNARKKHRYTTNKSYYVVTDSRLKKMSLNEASAKITFGANWKSIREFVSKGDLNFKYEDTWRKIIAFQAELK